jgi:hypothetical protein
MERLVYNCYLIRQLWLRSPEVNHPSIQIALLQVDYKTAGNALIHESNKAKASTGICHWVPHYLGFFYLSESFEVSNKLLIRQLVI